MPWREAQSWPGRIRKARGADALRLHSGRVAALASGAGGLAGRPRAGILVDFGPRTVLWGTARKPRDRNRHRARVSTRNLSRAATGFLARGGGLRFERSSSVGHLPALTDLRGGDLLGGV